MKYRKIMSNAFTLKPDSRALIPIFTAVSTFISALFVELSGIKSYWIFVIAPAMAGTFILIFDALVFEILDNYERRARIDSRSKFEGVWLEFNKFGDDIMYAGFSIKYTGKRDEPYIVRGDAYYSNGRKYAEWRSLTIKFDVTANTVDYFYSGRFLGDQNHEIKGFAQFSFAVSPGYVDVLGESKRGPGSTNSTMHDRTRPHSGTGFLVDDSPLGTKKTVFQFIRVTSPIMKEVMGENIDCKDFEIERQFIIDFHKKYGQSIKDNDYLFMTQFK